MLLRGGCRRTSDLFALLWLSMQLLQLSLAAFRLLSAGWDLAGVARRTNVGFGVVIGRYLCV
jgi:hypothetical protein